jgi:hypothetical protein
MRCERCDGSGRVAWGNSIARGGRMGPCPRCQKPKAKTFARARLTPLYLVWFNWKGDQNDRRTT